MGTRPFVPENKSDEEVAADARLAATLGEEQRAQASIGALSKTKQHLTEAIEAETARLDSEIADKRAERDRVVAECETEIIDAKKRRDDANTEADEADARKKTLESGNADLETTKNELTNECDQIRANISVAEKDLKTVTDNIENQKREEVRLKDLIGVLDTQSQTLTDEVSDKTQKRDSLTTEITTLTEQVNLAQKNKDQLEADTSNGRADFKKVSEDLADARVELAKTKAENEGIKVEQAAENERISQRVAALKLIEDNVDIKIARLKGQAQVDAANDLAAEKGLE